MDTPSILISILLTMLGVFAGYWFKKTNTKIDEIEKENKITDRETIKIQKDYEALKASNEQAELQLKKDMGVLAKDMGDFAKSMVNVNKLLNLQAYEIDNIKDKQVFLVDELRYLREKNESK